MPKQITRVRWSASGLPNGISFDEITGTFSGTPEETGQFSVPVTVETNYASDRKNIQIDIVSPYWERHINPIHSSDYNDGEFSKADKSEGYMYCYDDILIMPYRFYGSSYYHDIFKVDKYDIYSRLTPNDHVWRYDNNSATSVTFYDWLSYDDILYYTHRVNSGSSTADKNKWVWYLTPAKQDNYYNIYNTISDYPCAMCYNPKNDTALFVSPSGRCWQLYYANNTFELIVLNPSLSVANGKYYVNIGLSKVANACVKYSSKAGVFCACGNSSSAVSSDGIIWEIHTLPFTIVNLWYYDNLEKFVALGTNKILYSSNDGAIWEQMHSTPIPLNTIARVAYSQEMNTFAVVGGTGKYAYFSKDLETWIPSQIFSEDLTALDIIYFPAAKCWVFTANLYLYYFTKSANAVEVEIEKYNNI